MTTFRTCNDDMLGFIDWLIEKSEISNDWSEIRYVLEKPYKYMSEYQEYQDHLDKEEGIIYAFRCKICEKIVPVKAHSKEDYESLRKLGMCKVCYLSPDNKGNE